MRRYVGLLVAAGLMACSGGGPVDPPPAGPGPVSFVTLSPASPSVELPGHTVQLSARAADQAGVAVTGQNWSWATSDSGILTVDEAGLASAVSVGTATITATTDGVSGSLLVRVTGPTSLAFLDGSWTVTRSDGAVASTGFQTLTGQIREEVRTREGTEILRSLTRIDTDGSTWLYARADAERRRMQYFVGSFPPGQTETIATTPDGTGRIVLQNVSTSGFRMVIQARSGENWIDEITEEYVR